MNPIGVELISVGRNETLWTADGLGHTAGSGEVAYDLIISPTPESSPPNRTAIAASEEKPMVGFATRFFNPNRMKTAPKNRTR